MKKRFPTSVLLLLVSGLLIVSISQLIARRYALPDHINGFIIGLGIGLELVALYMGVQYKKSQQGG